MSNAFDERRKALEESFFRKENEKLLDDMKAQARASEAKAALSQASAITDDGLLGALVDQGIEASTVSALALVPLVWVAWADRDMNPAERDAILKAATEEGIASGSPAHDLLQNWLAERPEQGLFDAWRSCASSLDDSTAAALRKDVAGRARRVAEAAGGFLGLGAISAGEKEALEAIAAALD